MKARQLSFYDLKKSCKIAEFSRRTIHGHESQRGRRKLFRPWILANLFILFLDLSELEGLVVQAFQTYRTYS